MGSGAKIEAVRNLLIDMGGPASALPQAHACPWPVQHG